MTILPHNTRKKRNRAKSFKLLSFLLDYLEVLLCILFSVKFKVRILALKLSFKENIILRISIRRRLSMDLLDSLLFVDCGVVFVKSLLVLWSLVTVMSTNAFVLNT